MSIKKLLEKSIFIRIIAYIGPKSFLYFPTLLGAGSFMFIVSCLTAMGLKGLVNVCELKNMELLKNSILFIALGYGALLVFAPLIIYCSNFVIKNTTGKI